MRQVLRLRKKSQNERQEEETVLEVYLHALGMLGGSGSSMTGAPGDMDGAVMDAAE